MVVEVESNSNCEISLYARFKESGPARRIFKVRTFERRPDGEWCLVTGWTDDPDAPSCAAYAQQVEDSGAGVSYLIFGGLWGIRLKPAALDENWSLESRNQWGEPYLLLADATDLVFEEGDR